MNAIEKMFEGKKGKKEGHDILYYSFFRDSNFVNDNPKTEPDDAILKEDVRKALVDFVDNDLEKIAGNCYIYDMIENKATHPEWIEGYKQGLKDYKKAVDLEIRKAVI